MRHQWATSDAQLLRMERQSETATSAAVCCLERGRQDVAIRTAFVSHDCASLLDNLNLNVMCWTSGRYPYRAAQNGPPASSRVGLDSLAARRAWRSANRRSPVTLRHRLSTGLL